MTLVSIPNGPAHTAGPSLHQLTTPRAAGLAGVLFAFLFGATLILIRVKMPEGLGDSSEWLDSQKGGISTATKLMPFAGITFLWFIGVVRDNLGRYEDRFFASVFLCSGVLFLAQVLLGAGWAIATDCRPRLIARPAARAFRLTEPRPWRRLADVFDSCTFMARSPFFYVQDLIEGRWRRRR